MTDISLALYRAETEAAELGHAVCASAKAAHICTLNRSLGSAARGAPVAPCSLSATDEGGERK